LDAAGVPDHSGGSAPDSHRLPITTDLELVHRTAKPAVGAASSGVHIALDKKFGSPKIIPISTLESVSASIQDYTKAVYALESRAGEPVSTNDLADRLGVTPGSVSAMVRKLSEVGLVEHEPYRGVRLTKQGREVALEVLRHHRLLELFLAEELGMSWDRVHAEAEVLEHVISEDLERLIAARLGDPTVDPHGDPIPSAAFEIEERPTRSLDELQTGARGRFVRVSDSNPEMLRYLHNEGVALGDELEVTGRQPFGGPVFVRVGRRELALGGELAKAMRIEVQER
jgi:DtxR family Mn-dependent transcriptional regulator